MGRHDYGGERGVGRGLVQFVDARELQEGVQQQVRRALEVGSGSVLERELVLGQQRGVGRCQKGGGRRVKKRSRGGRLVQGQRNRLRMLGVKMLAAVAAVAHQLLGRWDVAAVAEARVVVQRQTRGLARPGPMQAESAERRREERVRRRPGHGEGSEVGWACRRVWVEGASTPAGGRRSPKRFAEIWRFGVGGRRDGERSSRTGRDRGRRGQAQAAEGRRTGRRQETRGAVGRVEIRLEQEHQHWTAEWIWAMQYGARAKEGAHTAFGRV